MYVCKHLMVLAGEELSLMMLEHHTRHHHYRQFYKASYPLTTANWSGYRTEIHQASRHTHPGFQHPAYTTGIGWTEMKDWTPDNAGQQPKRLSHTAKNSRVCVWQSYMSMYTCMCVATPLTMKRASKPKPSLHPVVHDTVKGLQMIWFTWRRLEPCTRQMKAPLLLVK